MLLVSKQTVRLSTNKTTHHLFPFSAVPTRSGSQCVCRRGVQKWTRSPTQGMVTTTEPTMQQRLTGPLSRLNQPLTSLHFWLWALKWWGPSLHKKFRSQFEQGEKNGNCLSESKSETVELPLWPHMHFFSWLQQDFSPCERNNTGCIHKE